MPALKVMRPARLLIGNHGVAYAPPVVKSLAKQTGAKNASA